MTAGEAKTIQADLEEAASIGRFCDQVLEDSTPIDILVHNAGVGIYTPSYATDPQLAHRLMALNFLAPVEITRRLLPAMPNGGSIIAVSSIAGKVPVPGLGVYAASKHALIAYADILRMEVRKRDIHVMSVCPGYVNTPFAGNMLESNAEFPRTVRRFALTAERCAEAIHHGLARRKRTIVLPRAAWAMIAAERLFPGPVHRMLSRWASGERTN